MVIMESLLQYFHISFCAVHYKIIMIGYIVTYLIEKVSEKVLLEGGGDDVLADGLQEAAHDEDVVKHSHASQQP